MPHSEIMDPRHAQAQKRLRDIEEAIHRPLQYGGPKWDLLSELIEGDEGRVALSQTMRTAEPEDPACEQVVLHMVSHRPAPVPIQLKVYRITD